MTERAENVVRSLRDVILTEADFLNLHAEVLDVLASGGLARSVAEKRAKVSAIACRARAKMLHDVLEASEPKAAPADDGHPWYIRKNGMFYRPNAAGYTESELEAGRYSLEEAMAHCENSEGVTMHMVRCWPPKAERNAS